MDYYKILGITKSASADEIKKAYRKLAMENHPDKHKDKKEEYEKKFRDINEAYSILSDPAKRNQYDKMGHSAFSGSGGYDSGFSGGFSSKFDFGDIHDIFDSFFNNSGSSKATKRKMEKKGSDLRYILEVTLEEIFTGVNKTIEFKAFDKCQTCNGFGSSLGKREDTVCSVCRGSGAMRIQQGFFIMEQTCQQCHGNGCVIANPCKVCNSLGIKQTLKKVSVSVPSGINEGMSIKINGSGEAGERGGACGDLYVVISILKHKFFQKDGNNLLCEIPIRFTQAALGAEIEIVGIDKKKISFDVPKGTQTGQKVAVKGEGLPIMGRIDKRGDLIVTLHLETPIKLTKEQEDILRKFDEVSNPSSNPKSDSFFDSIKNFFS
jgi:molecular chaperone DnaJ